MTSRSCTFIPSSFNIDNYVHHAWSRINADSPIKTVHLQERGGTVLVPELEERQMVQCVRMEMKAPLPEKEVGGGGRGGR